MSNVIQMPKTERQKDIEAFKAALCNVGNTYNEYERLHIAMLIKQVEREQQRIRLATRVLGVAFVFCLILIVAGRFPA